MQLDGFYEVFEMTQCDGVSVSNARDKKTGKHVQIHLFPYERISEASQICARLLSLPGEARNRVLKYGQEGSSAYFITEPLPAGQGLADWVVSQAAPQSAANRPEVGARALENLRKMEIQPAPLKPLPPGPEAQGSSAEPAPVPEHAPRSVRPEPVRPEPVRSEPVRSEPRVRPMRPAGVMPEAAGLRPGEFTQMYSGQEIMGPKQSSPAPEMRPSPPVSSHPSIASMGFTQIYGDLKVPAPPGSGAGTDFVDSEPVARNSTHEPASGLETFIGILKTGLPAPAPPPASPQEQGWPPFVDAPPAPNRERPPLPPPQVVQPGVDRGASRVVKQTITFPAPFPRPPAFESPEPHSFPQPLPPMATSPQPVSGQPAREPEQRRNAPAVISWRMAMAVALGLVVVAALVVLIVEIPG